MCGEDGCSWYGREWDTVGEKMLSLMGVITLFLTMRRFLAISSCFVSLGFVDLRKRLIALKTIVRDKWNVL